MLRTSDLDYDLPPDQIATLAATPRDAARLMVVDRATGMIQAHAHVRDLPAFLDAGDLLVLNTTRVIPARFEGIRADTGGKAQGLYLTNASHTPRRWVIYLKARRQGSGVRIDLTRAHEPAGVSLVLESRSDDEAGAWIARVEGVDEHESDAAVLDRVGLTPLPPYILQARKSGHVEVSDAADRDRYQTVFAAGSGSSVAAPTAGLHLTPGLLDELRRKGISRADVTLTVGSGTFKPVETEFVEAHPIHAEWCSMATPTRDAIVRTREGSGRVIGVGTTSVRTIESFAGLGSWTDQLDTRLLITPGYRFAWTDGMLTNFHLPRSSLMAMVGAFLGDSGVERLKALYAEAIARGYRFYSYGDAMLILPSKH